jgi:hypothetical protein
MIARGQNIEEYAGLIPEKSYIDKVFSVCTAGIKRELDVERLLPKFNKLIKIINMVRF